MSVALAILAGGASARLGECKALARIGDTCALRALLAGGDVFAAEPPLVIAGSDFDAIRAAAPRSCEVALNPDWQRGRTTSVALARRLRPGRDLCLAPVDVPLVPLEVFAALSRAWLDAGAPARGWLAPSTRIDGTARYGHPLIAGRELLLELDPLAPLRQLRARAEPLLEVQVATERILDDLDTPADLDRLRSLFLR